MDTLLKIDNVKKIKISKFNKIKTKFSFKRFLKKTREENNDINFVENLIIDEILEAEDGK